MEESNLRYTRGEGRQDAPHIHALGTCLPGSVVIGNLFWQCPGLLALFAQVRYQNPCVIFLLIQFFPAKAMDAFTFTKPCVTSFGKGDVFGLGLRGHVCFP